MVVSGERRGAPLSPYSRHGRRGGGAFHEGAAWWWRAWPCGGEPFACDGVRDWELKVKRPAELNKLESQRCHTLTHDTLLSTRTVTSEKNF